MVRDLACKLRVTAALLGCASQKDLCARFHEVNAGTTFELDRSYKGVFLMGALLFEARLSYAYLSGAHLDGAILRFAELNRASVEDARLDGSDLRDAVLDTANLRLYIPTAESTEYHKAQICSSI